VPPSSSHGSADATARLMLVAVGLAWGLTWVAMKIALQQVPPFSMRIGTSGIATLTLLAIALVQRRDLRIGSIRTGLHLVVSGTLNVASFTLFSAFAQLATTTARVAVLTYTMPIWAALLARPILGERLDRTRGIALLLCIIGLAILIHPLIGTGDVAGLTLALATAVSWACGTVYLKWAHIDAHPFAIATWQVIVALVITVIGLFIVEGSLHLWPVRPITLGAVVFAGLFGSAFAYLLWFEIVRRLSAMTASLGVLSSPVVGVIASVLVLGERPTTSDIIGFTLILAAAACVLLPPTARAPETAPIEQ
jgi:drug/metabolite transporter (DMT)-like permease